MFPDRLILIGAALALLALLIWIDIRREVARAPALKKLKWWQLLGGYLLGWVLISLLVDLFF